MSWNPRGKNKYVKKKYQKYTDETVKDIIQYPIDAWPEAGIRKETMEYYGCRVKRSEQTLDIEAVYFPAYSKDGKRITGYQKKDLTVPKDENGHFTAIGIVRTTCMLYGQKQCQYGGKKLWVTEGWKDMMSAFQALKEKNKGTQYENLNPNVVSIVNGTTHADKSIAHNEEFVKSFQQIVICMDPDYRKPIEKENVIRGKEAEDLIGSYLSSNNLLVPNYEGERDLNEILLEEGFKVLHDLLMWNVRPFQAEKIITFDNVMTFEESIEPIKEGIMFNNFPLLNEALLGFRPHELTTITGLSGTGKSTFAFELCYQCAEMGHKVGLIMLEDPIKKTQQRIAARYLNINPKNYFINPIGCGRSQEELRDAWDFSIDPNNFIVLNHFGSIASKTLMSKVKSLTASGCEIILLDHANMCVSGMETNDERKDLDVLYTNLAAHRAAHPVHLGVVAHVDKRAGSQEPGRPSEPKWNYISTYNLRGSAGMTQLSCNIILLHSELLPSGKRGRVMIGIGKNREMSIIGDQDIVSTNWKTGLFMDASQWVYDKEKGIMVPPNKLDNSY